MNVKVSKRYFNLFNRLCEPKQICFVICLKCLTVCTIIGVHFEKNTIKLYFKTEKNHILRFVILHDYAYDQMLYDQIVNADPLENPGDDRSIWVKEAAQQGLQLLTIP